MEETQEIKQSNNSRFVTVPGLLILLIFTLLAIYYRATVIAAFLCFFLLVCFASRFWSRGVLSRVRLEAEPVISSCHVGETLQLSLKVRNLSFFPLVWLDVILPMGPVELARSVDDDTVFCFTAEGSNEDQTGIRERFVWLLWQQEISWEEDLLTLRRGACLITEARLMAGDGFGLSAQSKRQTLKTPFELIIYPRMYEVNAEPFLRSSSEALARSRGVEEDVTILKGSRPYMPGDSVKRINWRVLAQSGKMEIKMFETVMPGCAAFILDILSFHRMVKQRYENGSASDELVPEFQEEDFELMISFIASCIHAISERNILPALIIPAYKERDAELIFPQGDEEDETRCMEALAKITFKGRKNDAETQMIHFPWEEFWELSHSFGDVYICSMDAKRAGYQQLADELGAGKVHRICLNGSQEEDGGNALYVRDLMPSAFARDEADAQRTRRA